MYEETEAQLDVWDQAIRASRDFRDGLITREALVRAWRRTSRIRAPQTRAVAECRAQLAKSDTPEST